MAKKLEMHNSKVNTGSSTVGSSLCYYRLSFCWLTKLSYCRRQETIMWCCPKLPYFLKIAKGKKGKSQQKNVQLSNSWQLFAAISPKIKLFLSSEERNKMSSERENTMYLEAIILFVRWTMFTHKSALLCQYLQTMISIPSKSEIVCQLQLQLAAAAGSRGFVGVDVTRLQTVTTTTVTSTITISYVTQSSPST